MIYRLQDLILPKASFIFKRMEEEDTIVYECRDCKAYLFEDYLFIKHRPSNIYIKVDISLIWTYREEKENV